MDGSRALRASVKHAVDFDDWHRDCGKDAHESFLGKIVGDDPGWEPSDTKASERCVASRSAMTLLERMQPSTSTAVGPSGGSNVQRVGGGPCTKHGTRASDATVVSLPCLAKNAGEAHSTRSTVASLRAITNGLPAAACLRGPQDRHHRQADRRYDLQSADPI